MKIFQYVIWSMIITAICGCTKFNAPAPITDPVIPKKAEAAKAGQPSVIIPEAQDDPKIEAPQKEKALPQKMQLQKPEAEKKAVPPAAVPPKKAPEENKENIVREQPKLKEKMKRPPRSPEHYRRGPGLWRAFSRLSSKEQEELIKLQRSDPKKFESVMREKADQLYEAEKLRRKEQFELVLLYKKESDPAKKADIKARLRKKIQEEFLQRLQDTRRDIESHKCRTAKMEKELQKREANREAIVDAILQHRLQKADKQQKKDCAK